MTVTISNTWMTIATATATGLLPAQKTRKSISYSSNKNNKNTQKKNKFELTNKIIFEGEQLHLPSLISFIGSNNMAGEIAPHNFEVKLTLKKKKELQLIYIFWAHQ